MCIFDVLQSKHYSLSDTISLGLYEVGVFISNDLRDNFNKLLWKPVMSIDNLLKVACAAER
jgi:hypothetical protein